MRDVVEKPTELADYPVVLRWPVQWGDQDSFGHVNNTVYFRWFETARIAYLEAIGKGEAMSGHGLGPILARITCNYRRQLTYPDTVLLVARVTRIGNSSIGMEHAIYSETQKSLVADGESVVVMINYDTNQTMRVPDDWRQAIQSLEGKPLAT